MQTDDLTDELWSGVALERGGGGSYGALLSVLVHTWKTCTRYLLISLACKFITPNRKTFHVPRRSRALRSVVRLFSRVQYGIQANSRVEAANETERAADEKRTPDDLAVAK